jgi:hypothetical protein
LGLVVALGLAVALMPGALWAPPAPVAAREASRPMTKTASKTPRITDHRRERLGGRGGGGCKGGRPAGGPGAGTHLVPSHFHLPSGDNCGC